ncbi:MAG TPA: RluA family pseudouridine synthase [Planctomycetota bacterium]|nr:RluA family pseudouridine synthase [Planctomycetota bacterium]
MSAWTILHDDNHVLALMKPAGVPSVPDESRDESALDAARDFVKERYKKPGAVYLGVVHRLDRPVGGILVFARTSKAASRLSEQFRANSVRKTYLALGEGRVGGREGLVEQWLFKDQERNLVSVVEAKTPGAKLATTHWRVLASGEGTTLFEFEPRSGRSHQLRLAARTLGAPLAGDLKYGATRALEDGSVALFAARLELEHPTLKTRLVLEIPRSHLPDWAKPAR